MTVVVVASLKGGVGKSTLSALLGILGGLPVVDYDPAAGVTELLAPLCEAEPGLMVRLEFCSSRAGPELVPATPDAYDIEHVVDIVATANSLRRLGDVVVDTGPAWNRFTIAALKAADVVLVPVSNSVLAERGAGALVRRMRRYGFNADVVLVPSLYTARNIAVLVGRVKRVASLLRVRHVEVGLRSTHLLRDATGEHLAHRVRNWNTHPLPELRDDVGRLLREVGLK